MRLLNFENDQVQKKSKKKLKTALGLSILALIAVIGSTFAANITLNSGAIQFGQGVQQAVACDSTVTITPYSTYSNAANATGSFNLGSIQVSNIDAACDGKTFIIRVYNNTADSTALTLAAAATATPAPTPTSVTVNAIKVKFKATSTFSDLANSPEPNANYSVSGTATSFTVTLNTALAAGDIYNITLEETA